MKILLFFHKPLKECLTAGTFFYFKVESPGGSFTTFTFFIIVEENIFILFFHVLEGHVYLHESLFRQLGCFLFTYECPERYQSDPHFFPNICFSPPTNWTNALFIEENNMELPAMVSIRPNSFHESMPFNNKWKSIRNKYHQRISIKTHTFFFLL